VIAYDEAVKYLLEDNARSDVMKDELLLNKQMEKTTEFYGVSLLQKSVVAEGKNQ
jgi:hypothetical protein